MRAVGESLEWAGGRLIRLLDGVVSFGQDFFPDPRGAEIPQKVDLPVQAYLLLRQGVAPVLIDTGSGSLYGDKGGALSPALAAHGISTQDIGTVLMTHMHGDHCGGLIDPGFDRAVVWVSQAEAEYWPTQDHPSARYLQANAAKVRVFAGGDSPVPGVSAWSLPGHTPGHSGFVIEDLVAVIGDVMHRADIQLPDPLIATKFDVDRTLATATRLSALSEIAERNLVCCGGHVQSLDSQSPFLRLQRSGSGFVAMPV